MKKYLVLSIIVVMALSLVGPAFAAPEWVPLTKGAVSKTPTMKLVPTRDSNTKIIEISVPGFYREVKRAGGSDATFVTTDLSSRHMQKGMPEVPSMKNFIMLKDGEEVSAKIVSEDWAEVKMKNAAAPSKGHITRNINPEEVKYEYSDFYQSKNVFPGMDNKVAVSESFVMRDVRGVEITVNPFQYDNARKTMMVAKKMRVELKFNSARNSSVKKAVPYEFAEIYKNTFINFNPTDVIERIELGNVLVIAADQFAAETAPLVEWKAKQGFGVKFVKMSEVGTTADNVYAFIKNEYEKTGLAYIILVGDTEFVPTLLGVKERAASDPCYTKLAGNDHVPDAMISRLSGKTVEDIKNQVSKIVHYEQFPATGADAAWYRKAVGIASAEGSPADYERANWLRDGLMKYNFDVVDQIYDPRAPKDKLIAAINEGRSVINYIGHGSKTAWVTTYFGNNDALALKNQRKLPVIWSVACVNGQFNGGSDCFCEAWMKSGSADFPGGAAAILGSSTNAEWVPPCDMQSEINLVQTAGEKQSSVGALTLTGVLKAMQIWGTAPNSSGVMLFEQHNIFGDCTMLVRNDVPKAVEYKAVRNGDKVSVTVTAGGKAVKLARVAIAAGEGKEAKAAVTDENGKAVLAFETLKDEKATAGSITITGLNLVPVVDSTVSL